MTVAVVICTVLLGAAGALALVRLARGPSTLDRAVATDVLVAIAAAAIGVESAADRDSTTLPILLVLAFAGFVGSVSVARFISRKDQ